MNRVDIYNKYVDPLKINYTCFRMAQYDYEYKGMRYNVYKTRDTGVMFSCATRSGANIPTSIAVDCDGNDVILIKCEISGKKTRDGVYIPCVSVDFSGVDFCAHSCSAILDLSGGNLSNVLYIKVCDYLTHFKIFKEIIYPTGSKGLKPVLFEGILGKDSWRDNIRDIDFKYAKSMGKMFETFKDITEFSFDWLDTSSVEVTSNMFYKCDKLKKVTGSIKSDKLIDATLMFYGCTELEEISDNLFAGVNLGYANGMFNMCGKLKNKPINPSNLKKMLNTNTSLSLYVGCNSLDSGRMFRVMQTIMKRHRCDSPFLDMEGYFSAGKGKVLIGDIAGMFKSTSLRVLDMSEIAFMNDGYGLFDLFTLFWSTDSSVGSCSIYKISNREEIRNRVSLLVMPPIIVVNKTLKLHDVDSDVYNIINMDGCSKDEVNAKMQTLNMLDSDENYIMVV